MSPTYLFKAIDHDGSRLEGEVDADSTERAAWMLKQQYPRLQRVSSLKLPPTPSLLPVRLPPAQVVSFYRRLAVLLEAGVNIDKAFAFLVDSSDGALAEVVDLLRKDTIAGRSLNYSISRVELSHIFTPLARGLIGTGLQTGALAGSLTKLADITERRFSQRQAFLSALTYPAILSFCIAGVALLFLLFLAPGETGLFSMLGNDLPWPSKVLVDASTLIRNPLLWATLLTLVVVSVPLFKKTWAAETGLRTFLDRKLLSVPLLGPLIRKSSASQVLYVWSTGTRVGLPLTTALALSLQMVANTDIRSRLKAAAEDFHEGGDLGEALRLRQVFPPLVTSMVSVATETGAFDEMMERVSSLYEEEVDVALSQLSSVLEPLLLIIAGFMAGFVALACLMPMLRLTSHL